MDTYTATGIIEGWIPCEDEDKVLEAWQYLHDTRQGYKLQGWFGRTLKSLLDAGIINP